MHEFILWSQIPASRHEQVLHILSGVCGMQPVELREQNLIYRQLQLPPQNTSKKSTIKQTTPQRHLQYHKLVRDLDDPATKVWALRIEELPDAGNKNVNARAVSETTLSDAELDKFRGGSEWYRYVAQFTYHGQQFIHKDVIIRVVRMMIPPEGTGLLEPLDAPKPSMTESTPKDPSGAFIIQATVRVEDGSNSKITEEANKQLLAFKTHLSGAIDLRPADRLALDTRVKET